MSTRHRTRMPMVTRYLRMREDSSSRGDCGRDVAEGRLGRNILGLETAMPPSYAGGIQRDPDQLRSRAPFAIARGMTKAKMRMIARMARPSDTQSMIVPARASPRPFSPLVLSWFSEMWPVMMPTICPMIGITNSPTSEETNDTIAMTLYLGPAG